MYDSVFSYDNAERFYFVTNYFDGAIKGFQYVVGLDDTYRTRRSSSSTWDRNEYYPREI